MFYSRYIYLIDLFFLIYTHSIRFACVGFYFLKSYVVEKKINYLTLLYILCHFVYLYIISMFNEVGIQIIILLICQDAVVPAKPLITNISLSKQTLVEKKTHTKYYMGERIELVWDWINEHSFLFKAQKHHKVRATKPSSRFAKEVF